ncbi:MAG: peptidylprolyl isomerase [Betaproteobacteria bacterium]|nr:peptidylprolyl isomerase [Betaproteobacteria bacterium]
MMHCKHPWIWLALAALAGLTAAAAAEDSTARAAAAGEAVFARVDGSAISVAQYEAELKLAYRGKFYHGKPPEAQLAQLRREVGDTLIERVLLLAEAKRRGIEPDAEKTRTELVAFEARYRDNPRWQQRRDQLLPMVTQRLEEQNVLARLEAAVRAAPKPGEKQLRAYFAAHPDTFTEPERLRLSVILLKVDPAASQADRDKAREEARAIWQRLAGGADFAALARERSGDASALNGGDMGYLHRGMLPEALHAQLDKMVPGALSEPITLLEGVAIFRFDERLPAQPRGFEESRERAAGLWRREREERQWREFKAGLRRAATIRVLDRSRYPSTEADRK